MKKVLTVILCAAIVFCAFSACSKNDEKPTEATMATVATTDDAVITELDAINLIKSYSAKELGLSKEDKEKCSFMVANGGRKIKNKYYVEVIATNKIKHTEGDQTTYTFDNRGQYYIRYDGKQILSKNLETGEYTEIKVKKSPTAEKETAAQHTTKK